MMPFLQHTAQYLWKTGGEGLSQKRVVFPNKRSALYFLQYLKQEVEGLFIVPECLTINELFVRHSDKVIADKLTLLAILYQSYKRITQTKEEFSEFYLFANLLLGDFDAVDKHLVDTQQLFRNIANLQAIDSTLSYLTEGQLAAIQQFWKSFEVDQHSKQQKLFLQMWKSLPKVYDDFNQSLEKEGIAYEGKVFREVAMALQKGTSALANTHHIFIGFNVLSKAEREVFRLLKNQQKATFFWDYDTYFTENKYHEAGRFIGKHIADFPNPNDFVQEKKINKDKDVTHLQCVTEVQQAKVLGEILAKFPEEELAQTAVVLANESLLPTVLESLPKSLGKVNISMGYPLKETAFMQFVELLLELQKTTIRQGGEASFSSAVVQKILHHPYASYFDEKEVEYLQNLIQKGNKTWILATEFSEDLTTIFIPIKRQNECYSYLKKLLGMLFAKVENNVERELMKQANALGQRLGDTLENVGNTVPQFFFALLIKQLKELRMPFQSEKEAGLQILGFLETRLLDFKNVFVLSANENFLPNVQLAGSLIPYNLRIGAGLPTLDEQNSMFAYYFYRLLSRADQMTLFSVSGSEQMQCKEQSRYIAQLKYEAPFEVKELSASATLQWVQPKAQIIEKDTLTKQMFQKFFTGERTISPSALNTYLRCPQQFYYKYIKGIKEVQNIVKAEDSNMFGSIFHKAAELLYKPYIGEIISAELLEQIGKKEHLRELILEAFRIELFAEEKRDLRGKELLILDTLEYFMAKLIKRDVKYAPFTILGLERKLQGRLEIEVAGQLQTVVLGGLIDRIDEKDGQIRIVDYKTGKVDRKFLDLEHLFIPCHKKRNPTALQTFLYAWLYFQNEGKLPMPCVYQLKEIEKEVAAEFRMGESRMGDPFVFAEHWQEYENLLQKLLGEIFGNEPCFFPSENTDECTHDAHSGICTVFGV